MSSARANGGNSFEMKLIQDNNWIKDERKFKFLEKKEHNTKNLFGIYYKYKDDITKMSLCDKPSLSKWDAVTPNGKIEIKKCSIKTVLSPRGVLYCEPFSKIGDQGKGLSKYFDDGYVTWNRLIIELFNHVKNDPYWTGILQTIQDNICDVVIEEDIVIPSKHIELFWCLTGKVKRLPIYFRIRDKYQQEYII